MKRWHGETSYEGEVPFHDCDSLRIVWHGHYYKYLEIARTALMRRHELDVGAFLDFGYGLVVIESRCRYAFPLRYGERFRVRAGFVDWEQRIHIAYEIWNLTQDRRSAKGWTTLVATTPEKEMLWETPATVRARIERGPMDLVEGTP